MDLIMTKIDLFPIKEMDGDHITMVRIEDHIKMTIGKLMIAMKIINPTMVKMVGELTTMMRSEPDLMIQISRMNQTHGKRCLKRHQPPNQIFLSTCHTYHEQVQVVY